MASVPLRPRAIIAGRGGVHGARRAKCRVQSGAYPELKAKRADCKRALFFLADQVAVAGIEGSERACAVATCFWFMADFLK
eukprot:935260-Alexandrium_andersonii.AAC.1